MALFSFSSLVLYKLLISLRKSIWQHTFWAKIRESRLEPVSESVSVVNVLSHCLGSKPGVIVWNQSLGSVPEVGVWSSGVARVSGAQGNAENWRPSEADMRTKKKHLMIPSI